jgi:cis-3-alkyl-4-acyloxetan-2-one decarboxylase
MNYFDEGEGDQPILCVHGNPTWSFTYRQIATELRDRQRVLAVDHIGCGLSDKPQEYPYHLAQHIANLVQLMETLDLRRVTMVVHDWGGAIGLGAAVEVPDRVSRLVILNTAAFPPPYIPLRIAACRWPVVGEWAMRKLNLFARAALTMTLARLPKLPEDVAAGLIAPYSTWHDRVGIARFVQDIPRRADHPTWQRLSRIEEGLATLRDRPTRIVWGMRDWCFRPECLERFQQLLPQARVQRLEDVGHYVMEEAAGEVLAAIEDCQREPEPQHAG